MTRKTMQNWMKANKKTVYSIIFIIVGGFYITGSYFALIMLNGLGEGQFFAGINSSILNGFITGITFTLMTKALVEIMQCILCVD